MPNQFLHNLISSRLSSITFINQQTFVFYLADCLFTFMIEEVFHHQTESSFQTRSSSVPLACFWHCYHWTGHMRNTFCWAHHRSEGVKIISNTKHMYLRGIKLGSKVVMIRTAMLKSNGALTTGTLVVFCSNYDGSLLPTAPVRCSLSLSLVTNAPFSFNARKHELSWTRNLWEGKQFLDYHIICLWNKIAHIVMCNFSYFEMIVLNK